MERIAHIRRIAGTVGCLMLLAWIAAGVRVAGVSGATPAPPADFHTGNTVVDVSALETNAVVDAALQADQTPDSTLEVPWNGVLWQSMPNFTWAACGLGANTRKAVDIAIGQWAYAAANQGIPIRLSEVACDDGVTDAQIRLFAASALDQPGLADRDYFGMTLTRDASNRLCGLSVSQSCMAQVSRVYLFTQNWERNQLTYEQGAKTIAHEIGHAIGLGHARYCNFDSLMAQNCEPILRGLGPGDVQSLDALADYVRTYFRQPAINAKPIESPVSGRGVTVTYHAGYNLVAGPRGTSFSAAAGPLYTFLAGDPSYRSLPAGQGIYGSWGYWAYFPKDVTVQLNGDGGLFYTADAPPGKWFLIGNDNGSVPMQVSGVDVMYTFDPQSGRYVNADLLQPGQAAWVKPNSNGFITAVATSLTQDQVRCYRNLGSPSSCSGP